MAVEIRADCGCGSPKLYRFCERHHLSYTLGLGTNRRLAAPQAAPAQAQRAASGAETVRWVGETTYRAESWPQPRRVVYKAEALAKGPNVRFVVTTRPDAPEALYDFSVDRGEPELWIKDLKNACFADRLSDHRFWANQFRLLLPAAAYWLLACGLPRLQLDTLRRKVIKIGGRVHEGTRRLRLHLASGDPGQILWARLQLLLPPAAAP